MARKSRQHNINKSISSNAFQWNAGLYIRLSKEDRDREDRDRGRKDDSNSVSNQKELLAGYVDKHISEFKSMDYYIDDGRTGTDSDRQRFQDLLNDIVVKRINCVIVKDLSRLSRNYSEAGNYIDHFFVRNNVRFICLAEPVIDSIKDPASVQSIAVPFYNIMNDFYAKQTSEKVRQIFDSKREQGIFIGAFAPYGYALDPAKKGHFIIDDEAAQIVRYIFTSFCNDGIGKRSIALSLNERGVLCPSAYKNSKGIKHNMYMPEKKGNGYWTEHTIRDILTNQVYIGDMVQGRYKIRSYKVHEQVRTPEDDWFVVKDTHDPIIDQVLFQKAQSLMVRDTRVSPGKNKVYLFSGFLRCADCNAAMHRQYSRFTTVAGKRYERKTPYEFYVCKTYKDKSKSLCARHHIKHVNLEAAVTLAIQTQISLVVEIKKVIAEINAAPTRDSGKPSFERLIAEKERELLKVTNYKKGLYQEKMDGYISQQEYIEMHRTYTAQIDEITQTIENLRHDENRLESEGMDDNIPVITEFLKYENFNSLTRELLTDLVEYIYITEGGGIKIQFKFEDHFKQIQYLIKSKLDHDTDSVKDEGHSA